VRLGLRALRGFEADLHKLPTEVDAITVEAVSTGERYSLDAYIRAVNNLERS